MVADFSGDGPCRFGLGLWIGAWFGAVDLASGPWTFEFTNMLILQLFVKCEESVNHGFGVLGLDMVISRWF